MIQQILLWFVLGVGASMALNLLLYDRPVVDTARIVASVMGAIIGALALLLAAPGAAGWTLLTALMGSIIGLAVVWTLEHGQDVREPW